MTGKLDPEAKRLRKLTDGGLADEVGGLEARIAALKLEAIRRDLRRAGGQGLPHHPDAARHLAAHRQGAFAAGDGDHRHGIRHLFCNTVQTGWRLTCTTLREFETPDP